MGVGGITVLFGLGFEFKIDQLFLILPFLIIANNYLYKAETIAIINAGNYIKKLESILYSRFNELNPSNKLGWESYIERPVYKPFDHVANTIFISLFGISYIKGFIFIWGELWSCSCTKIFNIIAVLIYSVVVISLYCYVLCFKTDKNERHK